MSQTERIVIAILVIAVVIMVGFAIIRSPVVVEKRKRILNQFIFDLKTEGFDMVKGVVDSPAVIIIIDDLPDFIRKADSIDSSVIYYRLWHTSMVGHDRIDCYAFNQAMTIAYRYKFTCSVDLTLHEFISGDLEE